MAYENLRSTEPNFTFSGQYFYVFDDTYDTLFAYTQDSTKAFSYPLSDPLVRNITSAEFDGYYFWTLETPGTYDVTIKKWEIINNYCKLIDQFDYVDDADNRYVSTAFTLENYRTTFSATVSGGADYVDLASYADIVESGNILTLGPNSNGEYENMTVTGTISANRVGLTFFTEYTYEAGDPICFNKNLWLFSDWQGAVNDGALYKINPLNGEVIERFDDNEYKDITACTFARITQAIHIGIVEALFYIKGTTLKFLNPNDLSVYTSMVVDNIQANGTTVIPVYDMVIHTNSVYRLQLRAMYFESDYTWSTYNFAISPIRNYIDSFVLDAYPTIIPANGVNVAQVRGHIKDQYGLDLFYKPVYFMDDDDHGFMQAYMVRTNTEGIAKNYYKAGIEARTVTINATATQFDD